MNTKPDQNLVSLKALEALERISEGSANKVFIPFDTSKAFGALGAASDLLKDK
ncbi:hypothetical protein D3C73_1474680 [compost metagenome]